MANIYTGRKSGNVLRRGSFQRSTIWSGTGMSQIALASATAIQINTFTAAFIADTAPFTIIRTRGLFTCLSDQSIATEEQEVILTHAVVTAQASAIGVTAVPTGLTDSDSDSFFVYEVIMSAYQFTLGSVVAADGFAARKYYDSKAMRKLEDSDQLSVVIESSATSEGMIVQSQFRTLLKLH